MENSSTSNDEQGQTSDKCSSFSLQRATREMKIPLGPRQPLYTTNQKYEEYAKVSSNYLKNVCFTDIEELDGWIS